MKRLSLERGNPKWIEWFIQTFPSKRILLCPVIMTANMTANSENDCDKTILINIDVVITVFYIKKQIVDNSYCNNHNQYHNTYTDRNRQMYMLFLIVKHSFNFKSLTLMRIQNVYILIAQEFKCVFFLFFFLFGLLY